MILSNGR